MCNLDVFVDYRWTPWAVDCSLILRRRIGCLDLKALPKDLSRTSKPAARAKAAAKVEQVVLKAVSAYIVWSVV